ncbi:lipopolysaccharide biosynthesis protein [Methanocorpusculum sp. GPch4]|uniref:lipopolysaccharide biosynthesis protein n=1 Tax=Methanocorpusculum sp. GPch4 TaxID=2527877 RepID=UPI0014332768|nr:oligosaccharide flippase family protein [Methanocorpusculum sp. GPch4]
MTEEEGVRQSPDANTDKKSFGKDVGKLVSGTVVAQIVAICLTPIITRIFSPEIYGVASVFISIVSIIVVIACMRYELAILLPKDDKDAGAVFLLCLIILVCVSLFTIPIMFLCGDLITSLLGNAAVKDYLFLVPVAVFIDGLYVTLRYWNTRRKRFGTQAATQALQSISRGGLQLGLGVGGYVLPGSLIIGQIVGNTIGMTILLGQILRCDLKLIVNSFSWNNILLQLKRYKKFPLIDTWGSWLNTISSVLPIFILSVYFSSTITGLYTLGYQILSIPLGFIGASIGQVFFQRASIAKHSGSLPELVENMVSALTSISIVPFAIIAVTGGVLFSVIFGSEWYEAGIYAQILTVWICLVFITSPISPLTAVLEIQGFGLKMNIFSVICRFFSLVIGGIMNNVYIALLLFMMTGVILVGYSNYYYVKSSGGRCMRILKNTNKYLLIAAAFLIIFQLMVILELDGWIILIAAGCVLILYEVYLFKRDRNVKNLINSA